MSMIDCHECGERISSEARACPKCGAAVPRTKWWLWGPLALVAVLLGIGIAMPDYYAEASEAKATCEAMAKAGLGNIHDCASLYQKIIDEGKAKAAR